VSTTIYSIALTDTTTLANVPGYSLRERVSPTGASQGQVRVSFKSGPNGLVVDHASIAVVGGATFPNVQNTPTELLFSGGHGFTLGPNTAITSDWVNFSSLSTDTLAIIADIHSSGTAVDVACNTSAPYALAYHSAAASYNLATVSSYTIGGTYGFASLIETQPGASTPFIFQPFAI
jgi:hypothetical protein